MSTWEEWKCLTTWTNLSFAVETDVWDEGNTCSCDFSAYRSFLGECLLQQVQQQHCAGRWLLVFRLLVFGGLARASKATLATGWIAGCGRGSSSFLCSPGASVRKSGPVAGFPERWWVWPCAWVDFGSKAQGCDAPKVEEPCEGHGTSIAAVSSPTSSRRSTSRRGRTIGLRVRRGRGRRRGALKKEDHDTRRPPEPEGPPPLRREYAEEKKPAGERKTGRSAKPHRDKREHRSGGRKKRRGGAKHQRRYKELETGVRCQLSWVMEWPAHPSGISDQLPGPGGGSHRRRYRRCAGDGDAFRVHRHLAHRNTNLGWRSRGWWQEAVAEVLQGKAKEDSHLLPQHRRALQPCRKIRATSTSVHVVIPLGILLPCGWYQLQRRRSQVWNGKRPKPNWQSHEDPGRRRRSTA